MTPPLTPAEVAALANQIEQITSRCDLVQSDMHRILLLARQAAAALRALQASIADMDHLLRASVPDRHKVCTSPVGSVQNYISELERALQNATGELL
jgi:hypothetical protein